LQNTQPLISAILAPLLELVVEVRERIAHGTRRFSYQHTRCGTGAAAIAP